jgi:hypothetical protein
MLLIVLSLLTACGDQKLNYKCTCTRIAYSTDENEEDIDTSFTENICDTYENIQAAFAVNGSIYNALEECRLELEEISDEYDCNCDCVYQSDC